MLALVRDPEGVPCGISRTYLARDGRSKATIASPRMFAGRIYAGSAVRLGMANVAGMAVAEGIETALVFASMHKIVTWALLSAENLAAFEAPEGVEAVTIAGDNDLNFVGQEAAYRLAKRASRLLKVTVQIPPDPGSDWADLVQNSQKTQSTLISA